LRERREDIGLLASYFLARVAERQGKHGMSFSPQAMTLLERYDYPRQRARARERDRARGDARRRLGGDTGRASGSDSHAAHAARSRCGERVDARMDGARSGDGHCGVRGDRSTWSLADVEKEHIQTVLALHRGNATTAAKQLGISRTTLWRKLRQYGLKRTGA
jgi:DNA-binding NtrC family response regulator